MTYHINAFNKRALTYDRNGNILSLTQHWPDAAASYISLIHLGSVRAVVVDCGTDYVLEINNFYPFGKCTPSTVTEPIAVTSTSSATAAEDVAGGDFGSLT